MLKRKWLLLLTCFVIMPAVIIGLFYLFGGKQYYAVSVAIIILSMIPFFLSLDRKKLQARELVILASTVAIAVAGRAAFFALPQIKPTCAIIMLAAIVFGPEFGFIAGSLSMLLSNFIFGQSMNTPFQMFGMGLAAMLCGLIFYKRYKGKPSWLIAIVGGILCFAVYGFVVDSGTVLIISSSMTLKSALAVYASGVLFNLIHAASTFLIILLAGKPIIEKLERIRIKYDLFSQSNTKFI